MHRATSFQYCSLFAHISLLPKNTILDEPGAEVDHQTHEEGHDGKLAIESARLGVSNVLVPQEVNTPRISYITRDGCTNQLPLSHVIFTFGARVWGGKKPIGSHVYLASYKILQLKTH
jgi:hypothetical protein